MLHLTIADIAHEYAPYNQLPGFMQGAADYQKGQIRFDGGQAYDRGAEAAMRVRRHNDWVEGNVGLN